MQLETAGHISPKSERTFEALSPKRHSLVRGGCGGGNTNKRSSSGRFVTGEPPPHSRCYWTSKTTRRGVWSATKERGAKGLLSRRPKEESSISSPSKPVLGTRKGGWVKKSDVQPADKVEFLRRLKARDPEACLAFWDDYSRSTRRMLRRIMGPDDIVDDLLQDVMLKTLSNLHNIQEPAALPGYVRMIALNAARMELRRRKRWKFTEFFSVTHRFRPDKSDASRAMNRLYTLIGELNADAQLAFTLRYFEGYELTEVAEALDVSLATAKRRLKGAREKIVMRAKRDPVLWAYVEGALEDKQNARLATQAG